MNSILQHIEYVKGKPHHIRRQVAFAWAAAFAGIIALVWFIANISSGVFALKDTSFADTTAGSPVTTVPAQTSGLAGAAAAAPEGDNAPAHIEIVNTAPAPAPKAEPTTLPF